MLLKSCRVPFGVSNCCWEKKVWLAAGPLRRNGFNALQLARDQESSFSCKCWWLCATTRVARRRQRVAGGRGGNGRGVPRARRRGAPGGCRPDRRVRRHVLLASHQTHRLAGAPRLKTLLERNPPTPPPPPPRAPSRLQGRMRLADRRQFGVCKRLVWVGTPKWV